MRWPSRYAELASRRLPAPRWLKMATALPLRHGRACPYRMHRSWNRSAAAIATSSWPGLSGPSVAARAGIGGPDKPGHDDGETLAAIEQAFDFMGFHGCFRNVFIP